MALLNSASELEIVLSLFKIELGIFLGMLGGWLEALLTYLMLLLGFLYGLCEPSPIGGKSDFQKIDRVALLFHTDAQLVVFEYVMQSFFDLIDEWPIGIFNVDQAIISVVSCMRFFTQSW